MKAFWHKRETAMALSAVLAALLLLSLCLPTLGWTTAQPENPIHEGERQPIELISAGSTSGGSGQGENGADPSQTGTEGPGPGGENGQGGGQESGENGEHGGNNQTTENEPAKEDPQQPQEGEDQPQPNTDPEQPTDDPETDPGSTENRDDQQGEDGSQETTLDLALVMRWYKYGTTEKTVVCAPGQTVGRTILESQLRDGRLNYQFSFTGTDAARAKITSVYFLPYSGGGRGVDAAGAVQLNTAANGLPANHSFTVTAQYTPAGEGAVTQELRFTVVVAYQSGIDLQLDLYWLRGGEQSVVSCAANDSAVQTVRSTDLTDGQFSYFFGFSGLSAGRARIVEASYSASGGESGSLDVNGGILQLNILPGKDSQRYTISVTAQVDVLDEDGSFGSVTVYYAVVLMYRSALDLQLNFVWYQNSQTPQTITCAVNSSASARIKRNQLNRGELMYQLELTGASAPDAEILSAQWQSPQGEESLAVPSGQKNLETTEDGGATRSTVLVTASVRPEGGKEQMVTFSITIRYSSDVMLELRYQLTEENVLQQKTLRCENEKEYTAGEIYDNQLRDDSLPVDFTLTGEDSGQLQIDSIRLYQSGNMKTITIAENCGSRYSGSVTLLRDGNQTGENTFTVQASDRQGNEYSFRISIPYKHRGGNTVQIWTSLEEGAVVTNGQAVELSVQAWSEDTQGNRNWILATGVNTRLIVRLDGTEYRYTGVSDTMQQYKLMPENDYSGDRNQHILYIYAEDADGNYGEKTITLVGKRTEAGQKIGTASISIDLTVLGLGVYGPIEYDVLSGEPVSYAVAKAVWGYDAGEIFGRAAQTFGWAEGEYTGTLDQKFYLSSIGDRSGLASRAMALSGHTWREALNLEDDSEEMVLAAIDQYFAGQPELAALWRCIYRNGLPVSTCQDSDSVGEFDFTGGSGWLYYVSGSGYPGDSMSNWYLKDGDQLILRYTLAYGWDVGGSSDRGNAVGYCVEAGNGSIRLRHQLVEDENGQNVCRCCGMVMGCLHKHTEWRSNDLDQCGLYCTDCNEWVERPQDHQWTYSFQEGEDFHTRHCSRCDQTEQQAHDWQTKKETDTATCTEEGTVTSVCRDCGAEMTGASPAKGHRPENRWYYDESGHWQKCQACGQEIEDSRGEHRFVYDSKAQDWTCAICGQWHDWLCGNDHLELISAEGEERKRYQCQLCHAEMEE